MTPSVSSNGSPIASGTGEGLAASDSDRCTTGCTSEAKTDHADPVTTLAAALLGMSSADRARLAALLVGQQPKRGEEET